jgi:hypothetical protein
MHAPDRARWVLGGFDMMGGLMRWALRPFLRPVRVAANGATTPETANPAVSYETEGATRLEWTEQRNATVPTRHAAVVKLGTPHVLNAARTRRVDATTAASAFLTWVLAHDLAYREWAVDDLWFLAAEDFAIAQGYELPPRRSFLGALQRQPDVTVAYDRRVFARDGRLKGKTTIYRLPIGEPSAGMPTLPTIQAESGLRAA